MMEGPDAEQISATPPAKTAVFTFTQSDFSNQEKKARMLCRPKPMLPVVSETSCGLTHDSLTRLQLLSPRPSKESESDLAGPLQKTECVRPDVCSASEHGP